MANRETWKRFLEGMSQHDEVVGVLVIDDGGSVTGRYGEADVFSDEAIGRSEDASSRDRSPNSEDVWMERIGDRLVLVAFERGVEVAPIQKAVEAEMKHAGL